MYFKRHEVVTEHQLGRDAANKLRIDALLAKVDERAPIALGKLLGPLNVSHSIWTVYDYRIGIPERFHTKSDRLRHRK
jgi:hypothetical protein